MIIDVRRLKEMAEIEFSDIVEDVIITDINELRIILIDGSFVDIWYSLKLEGRYSYHWERKHIDGSIFRHNNAPHVRWQEVKTFPKHFHNGDEDRVIDSDINDEPEEALKEFLLFIRKKLTGKK
ncbi:MAG: hypothetical protein COZ69_05245 [Deltaproteobacteria bacterium CG_4_8_14_3_um_filter_45_9]|nr:MAG: hypothetical protein COS40_01065 [Deltaproteobacteria bacterium CG03_land_8_20_14_0_80_45_14]PIX24766.1 MAG: hypothetical protein COZ69_05245 [Deltaproteobacteria bacterium CG_4_8_14_3_um_filter_45_9]